MPARRTWNEWIDYRDLSQACACAGGARSRRLDSGYRRFLASEGTKRGRSAKLHYAKRRTGARDNSLTSISDKHSYEDGTHYGCHHTSAGTDSLRAQDIDGTHYSCRRTSAGTDSPGAQDIDGASCQSSAIAEARHASIAGGHA